MVKLKPGDKVRFLYHASVFKHEIGIVIGPTMSGYGCWIKLESGKTFSEVDSSIRGSSRANGLEWDFGLRNLEKISSDWDD